MGRALTAKRRRPASAHFMTRAKALKRSQLRLADFRRVCILKGVYPREPKKKVYGNDKTYYHVKDIRSINRDPIVIQIRNERISEKRVRKAIGRREFPEAKRILGNRQPMSLQHLVKERYPCLVDAISELDDPLSTLAMFACVQADTKLNIPFKTIRESIRYTDEFSYFITRTGALRKVFASVKGYYFQADILSQPVTWLLPHNFTQHIPTEVDFKVLVTFADFYQTLMKFVNYKLYALNNLSYPPVVDEKMIKGGNSYLSLWASTYLATTNGLSTASGGIDPTTDTDSDVEVTEVAADNVPKKKGKRGTESKEKKTKRREIQLQKLSCLGSGKGIFKGLIVFISREVPLSPLSIVCLSGGASIGWDNEWSPLHIEDPSITHHIVDRNLDQLQAYIGESLPPREYIQPQWVFDSFNSSCLLPTEEYHPGKTPPPHLSPFVDDYKEGYVPKRRELLDSIIEEKKAMHKTQPGKWTNTEESDVEEELDGESTYQQNLELANEFYREIDDERKGILYSNVIGNGSGVIPLSTNNTLAADVDNNMLVVDNGAAGGLHQTDKYRSREIKNRIVRKNKQAADLEERQKAVMSKTKRRLKEKLESEKKSKVSMAHKLTSKREKLAKQQNV